jgi:dephospho-CoA kinase
MKKVIGIIGTIASGKDAAADYLTEKFHLPVFQISQPLKDVCAERGIEPTRQNLIGLGTTLSKEMGEDFLAQLLLKKIEHEGIITGMRQLAQIAYLKKHAALTLIGIDAEPSIRFDRVKKRNKQGEATNLEEFIQQESQENSAPNVQRLFECLQLANYHIDNNGSLEELYQQLDAIPLG